MARVSSDPLPGLAASVPHVPILSEWRKGSSCKLQGSLSPCPPMTPKALPALIRPSSVPLHTAASEWRLSPNTVTRYRSFTFPFTLHSVILKAVRFPGNFPLPSSSTSSSYTVLLIAHLSTSDSHSSQDQSTTVYLLANHLVLRSSFRIPHQDKMSGLINKVKDALSGDKSEAKAADHAAHGKMSLHLPALDHLD